MSWFDTPQEAYDQLRYYEDTYGWSEMRVVQAEHKWELTHGSSRAKKEYFNDAELKERTSYLIDQHKEFNVKITFTQT